MRSQILRNTSVLSLIALALASPALASRVGPEICGNGIDDDGDGTIDEAACLLDASSAPVSGDGVVPEAWTDNPGCSAIGFGDLYAYKIDGTPNSGTYPFPADPGNAVSLVVNPSRTGFSWDSTLPIQAVIIKAQNANVYVYDPVDLGDTGLATIGGKVISHVEFCYSYALVLEKDAAGDFTRTYDWSIEKSVEDELLTGFLGDELGTGYTVGVTRTMVDSDHRIYGSIVVTNPSPNPVSFTVTDEIEGGIAATVICPTNTAQSGESVVCTYAANVPDASSRLNTATVTSSDPGVPGGIATATAIFGQPTIKGYPAVHVTDTQPNTTGPWTTSGTANWSYPAGFVCPTDPAAYTAGVYEDTVLNTSTITETGQQGNASVTIQCFAPLVTTSALTSYTREYAWAIGKSVAPTSHEGLPGNAFQSTYQVAVERSQTEREFQVTGAINVQNPSSTLTLSVAVATDLGGPVPTLDCGGALTVGPNAKGECHFSAWLAGKIDGTNTATVTIHAIPLVATANWAFGDPTTIIGFAEVDVTDTNGPTWEGAAGSATWSYAKEFVCPTDEITYTAGLHEAEFTNTANITQTEQHASALVDLTCYLPGAAAIAKTTQEGPADIGVVPFPFQLSAPDGTVVETKYLDGAGEAQFDTELTIEGTWRITEVTPDGWLNDDPTCDIVVAFPASADQVHTCVFDNIEMGGFELMKLVNNHEVGDTQWPFRVMDGPNGAANPVLASATAPEGDTNGDGYLDFAIKLDPTQAYTVCGDDRPVGWASTWMVDTDANGVPDTQVYPYNPDAGEDLGTRCFDFGAGTGFPVVVGGFLPFEVDNLAPPPGGGPRTPGYWKNWSTCSNGNQAAKAAEHGGPDEGWWLLDDLLPLSWDNGIDDGPPTTVSTCEQGVAVLSNRDWVTGQVMAKDPIYRLARNLLAYQLNQGAGACLPTEPVLGGQTIAELAAEAAALLDDADFDGSGRYTLNGRRADKQDSGQVKLLAGVLDDYNNGVFCGSGE